VAIFFLNSPAPQQFFEPATKSYESDHKARCHKNRKSNRAGWR
jgi:hypothetical protein